MSWAQPIEVCGECGSAYIEVPVMVDPWNNEVQDEGHGYCYCHRCEAEYKYSDFIKVSSEREGVSA